MRKEDVVPVRRDGRGERVVPSGRVDRDTGGESGPEPRSIEPYRIEKPILPCIEKKRYSRLKSIRYDTF